MSTSEPKASRAKVHLAAPDRLIWVVVAAIVLWGVWAFGSELVLNFRLNQDVQQLREGNAQLAASNAQTRKQLSAGSPGSMEEAARKAGFTRPGEQVYVIVKPSASASAAVGEAASPSPVSSLARNATRQSATKHDGGVIGAIERWWRSLWH